MALIDRLPATEAAHQCARALEQLLGHDIMVTVADPVITQPTPQVVPDEGTRSVALPFGDAVVGEVTLVLDEQFATLMEAAAPDGSLLTASLPALQAAAGALDGVVTTRPAIEHAGEIATATLLTSVMGDFVIVPLLEGDNVVALMVVRVFEEVATAPSAAAPNTAPPAYAAPTPPPASGAPAAAPAAAPPAPALVAAPAAVPPVPTGEIALHVFQPLSDHGAAPGASRPLALLNDVKLQVVAELGRRRMKVRDLVALAPGSVIELDRAAGSPVDVMVNGALLAHGEVVVIDEEFGIRLSEIVMEDGA
jgi:flagellar motor switch protein FliN/FliY